MGLIAITALGIPTCSLSIGEKLYTYTDQVADCTTLWVQTHLQLLTVRRLVIYSELIAYLTPPRGYV